MRQLKLSERGLLALSILALSILLGVSSAAMGQAPPAQEPQQDEPIAYIAVLNGEQEVPPVATPAIGTARMEFTPRDRSLTWSVEYSGLTGPVIGAHFHGPGGAGQTAPVVVSLGNNLASPIVGSTMLTEEQAEQFIHSLWYVNIHTQANQSGEIRGPVVLEVIEVGPPR